MPRQPGDVRGALEALAREARRVREQTEEFQPEFRAQVAVVHQRIAGSATGADRTVADALDAAARAVRQACDALAAAERTARSCAARMR